MKLSALCSWETNPLKDWLWQRISAGVFLVYTAAVLIYWYASPNMTFATWHDFILATPMRILGSLALLSLVIHAWIGLWTVITDYVKGHMLSKILLTFIVALLLAYLGVGVFLLWGM